MIKRGSHGNVSSKKPTLDHRMPENIHASAPLGSKIFGQIVPGAGTAPEKKKAEECRNYPEGCISLCGQIQLVGRALVNAN